MAFVLTIAAWMPASALAQSKEARATPRRSAEGFRRACDAGDFARAAEFLDLSKLPRDRRAREAADIGDEICGVARWQINVDPQSLPDDTSVPGDSVVYGTVEIEGESVALTLVPVRVGADTAWLFSKKTVDDARKAYAANERRFLEEAMPPSLKRRPLLSLYPWQWIALFAALAGSLLVARAITGGLRALLHRVLAKKHDGVRASLRELIGPFTLGLFVAVFEISASYLLFPATFATLVGHVEALLVTVAVAWALLTIGRTASVRYVDTLPDDTVGDASSRAARTRIEVLRRVGTVLLTLVASGIFLMRFDVVRSIGVSILASAGIAGLLVGLAAQRTIGGIVSGIELSITQPIRIGDIVVIDGHQGSVERMFLTYVVVRLADERRLVVPVARITSQPFENWTRLGPAGKVTVEILASYEAPIDVLRAAFREACEKHPEFDGRTAEVQLADVTDKGIRLRGLATVSNVARAGVFRADLREAWWRVLVELEAGKYLPRDAAAAPAPKDVAPGAVAAGRSADR